MARPYVVLFVPDCHVPNEHRNAFNLMLKAAKVVGPDAIVLLGDFADCESLSAHEPTHSRGLRFFREERDRVSQRLSDLQGINPSAKLHYIKGNHEWRLERYIASRAAALDGLVNLDELLDLSGKGWEVTEYRETLKLGKLNVTHDTGSAGANAHRTSSRDYMGSAIIGHTHRMAYEVNGRPNGPPVLSAMFGWLGDPKKVDYVHQAKSAQWAHGFGVGYFDGNGVAHIQPVPIINNTCCVQGRIVSR
jgi:predicted phosphodiesterase